MKRELVFVMSAQRDSVFETGNIVLSLNKYMPDTDFDIVIYQNDLFLRDKEVLQKIKNVKLKEFDFPQNFKEEIEKKSLPIQLFGIYKIFDLLDDYKTAVWLDTNAAIQASIIGITNCSQLGLVFDRDNTGIPKISVNFNQSLPDYNMDILNHSAHIAAAKDALDYRNIYTWLLEQTPKFLSQLTNPAAGMLNLLLQQFNIEFSSFDSDEYGAFADSYKANVARIVRFSKKNKIWRNINILKAFPEWYRTHLEWLRLGGKDFVRDEVPNILFIQQKVPIENIKEVSFKIFGIPLLKIKNDGAAVRAYVCGITILKISRQENTYLEESAKIKLSLLQYLFAAYNERDYKIIRFFGIKMKLKRRKNA
ncbi:MAG: hypothetical protein LBV16_06460 [Elusimicrobiota bacterium]|nr:hypothetical protein [Elusimicrobiota bacterium]